MTGHRRTRTAVLILAGGVLCNAGWLVLLYRDDTEAGNFFAAALLLGLVVGAIVERLERHRRPLGSVATTTTFGLVCTAYLIGDLTDTTAITAGAFLVAYATLPVLGLLLYRLTAPRR